ncbi:MAG: SpoIIE family protein phosphatase, partial [Planctomycetota bacterium]
SDGFPDAEQKPSGRQFGSDAIAKCFASIEGSPLEVIEALVNHVDDFTQRGQQFDDMCVVCMKKTGVVGSSP